MDDDRPDLANHGMEVSPGITMRGEFLVGNKEALRKLCVVLQFGVNAILEKSHFNLLQALTTDIAGGLIFRQVARRLFKRCPRCRLTFALHDTAK